MLQLAGEVLPCISADQIDMIARKLSVWDLCQFSRFEWPGNLNRAGWTFPGMLRQMPPKLGSLYWPRDASRFAIGLFLATDQNIYNIRSKLQSAGIQTNDLGNTFLYGPGELVMSEEDQQFQTVGEITASMYMLPPRPLVSITGMPGLNLLTLVDQRFFWQFRDTGVISITEGETTWADVFDQLALALGVDIDFDDVSPNYLYPGAGLAAQYEQSGTLLDALAYNVGQRICVDLDGAVHSYSQPSSQEILQGTVALLQQDSPNLYITGGGFISSKNTPLLLPSAVRVTFPRSVGYVSLGQSYAVDVPLASLNLEELGQVGNGSTKTFHDSAAAEGATASAPTNAAALATLAAQIATDWYLYQLGPLDAKFEGVVDWGIEGLSDSVEWTYVKGEVSTRVTRPSWNDLSETLLHGPSPTDPPAWIKVTSNSPQTITLTSGGSRSITAAVFLDERIFRNFDADFTEADRGASVSGTGIPSNTTILYVNGSSEAVMSNAATGTLDSTTLTITGTGKTVQGFFGVVEQFIDSTGEWLYWDAQHFQWVTDNGSVNWNAVVFSVWFQGANDETPTANNRYPCRLLGQDEAGVPIWSDTITSAAEAYIKVTDSTAQPIYIGRKITDGVLNGTTTLTSASANFSSSDAGALLIGQGIPNGTQIQSVTNATTVVMTANASVTAQNVSVTIASGSTQGYAGVIDHWIAPAGGLHQWAFGGNGACWLLSSNSPDPTTANSSHNQFPLSLAPVSPGGSSAVFRCAPVGTDAAGVPIFVWPYDPAAYYDTGVLLGDSFPIVQYGLRNVFNAPASGTITLGNGFLLFGTSADDGTATGQDTYMAPGDSASQVGVAPQAYQGDTGTDAVGNQFVNGLNVAIGGGQVTGSINGGSFW